MIELSILGCCLVLLQEYVVLLMLKYVYYDNDYNNNNIIIKTFILLRERVKINNKCPSVDVNPTISKKSIHKNVIKTVSNSKAN